jgi:hypothetical protein
MVIPTVASHPAGDEKRSGGTLLFRAGYRNPGNALTKEKAQARKLAPNFISISRLADSEG